VKQLLLKKNNAVIALAIFLLAAFSYSNIFAQGAAGEDNSSAETIGTSEDSPFSVGQPVPSEQNTEEKSNTTETDKKIAPIAKDALETNDKSIKENTETSKVDSNVAQTKSDVYSAPVQQNNYRTGVILQGLNKITARTSKLEVKLDTPIKFGNLIITLHACWKSPPEEEPESKALLEMREEIPGEVRKKIFSGWMFAASPLLSAPGHPIYDITVVECTGEPFVGKKDSAVKENTPPTPPAVKQ